MTMGAPFREYLLGVAKTADYVLSAKDNMKRFTNAGASGAVNFPLPPLAEVVDGWEAEFFVVAGQSVTITAPSGKLVAFNNAAATSIAFSTASEKIGGYVRVVYDGQAAKYLAIVGLGAETQTPTIA